jgi:hypothetical protein
MRAYVSDALEIARLYIGMSSLRKMPSPGFLFREQAHLRDGDDVSHLEQSSRP